MGSLSFSEASCVFTLLRINMILLTTIVVVVDFLKHRNAMSNDEFLLIFRKRIRDIYITITWYQRNFFEIAEIVYVSRAAPEIQLPSVEMLSRRRGSTSRNRLAPPYKIRKKKGTIREDTGTWPAAARYAVPPSHFKALPSPTRENSRFTASGSDALYPLRDLSRRY